MKAPSVIGRSGHNLFVSFVSEFAVRLVGMATMVLLARYLEPSGFGYFSALLAYYALAVVLGNLGLDRLAVRELAGEHRDSAHLFGTLLRLRIAAGLFTGLVLFASGMLLKPEAVWLLALLSVALIPSAIGATYNAAFQARHDFGPPAAATAVTAIVALVATAVCVLIGASLGAFILVVVASEMMRAVWLVIAGWRAGWSASHPLDSALARRAVVAALPYGFFAILSTLYFRIDLIMLDALVGGAAVGHYASAFRILEAAAAFPTLVLAVLFPRFVVLLRADVVGARELYVAIVPLMLWLGLALGVAGIVAARPLLTLLFSSSYAAAAPAMVWLMVALVLLFLHAPNTTVLLSGDRLGVVVGLSALAVTFNIALNAFLIPRYEAVGAAAATVVSEGLSLLIFTPIVCRRLELPLHRYLRSLVSPRLAAHQLDLILDRSGSHQLQTAADR